MLPLLAPLRTTTIIMNLTKFPRRQGPGFTLIELLVVVAIIAVLAAIGFGAAGRAIEKGRQLAAKQEATSLVNAFHAYYADYSHYPQLGSSSGDRIVKSDAPLMNILLARGPEGKRKNSRLTKYYNGQPARGSSGREYGGLLYETNSAELFDKWPKFKSGQTRHYFVMWDADADGELLNPITNKIVPQEILVWSTGRDGQEARGMENDPKTATTSTPGNLPTGAWASSPPQSPSAP